MKIDRLLSIIVLLLSKDRVTASELAEKYEVSVRTIYRDLDAIGMAGIPIVSYPGINGGYGIMPEYRMSSQYFSGNDFISLLSTLQGVNTVLENRDIESVINKIKAMVPRHRESDLRDNEERIMIDILPWGYRKKEKEILKIIHDSIATGRLLEFTYNSYKGESFRCVEPMTLVFKGYAWYLFSYCREKNDYRFFRVSRIRSPRITSISFIRRKKSYKELDLEQESLNKIEVVLRFSPSMKFRVDDYFDEKVLSYESDGSIIVKAEFPDDEWMDFMVLGFGEAVEVIGPEKIRQRIKDIAGKICRKYDANL